MTDLAKLHLTVPGAGRMCAWTAGGRERCTLDFAHLPRGAAAVGVVWPIPHGLAAVELAFTAQAPTAVAVMVEVRDWDGNWLAVSHGLQQEARGNTIGCRFEPLTADGIRVRLQPGWPAIQDLAIRPYVPEVADGRITWPETVTGRLLEERLLQGDAEPSFAGLALHGLPMPAWATMGLKDLGIEQAVRWDGAISFRNMLLDLTLGQPARTLAEARDTVRRSLLDGWLPAVLVDAQVGQITVRQTSFVMTPAGGDSRPALFLRLELQNTGAASWQSPLEVRLRTSQPSLPDWANQTALPGDLPRGALEENTAALRLVDGVLHFGDTALLATVHPCRPGSMPAATAFDISLDAGGSATLDLVAPLLAITDEQARQLCTVSFDAALTQLRQYWKRTLAGATKLKLPEPRLNNLYKAVLVQMLINGHGDVMPYGSRPSVYDGHLFGVEEGYVMLALAMFGLAKDAQRYADGTYLTTEFLKKVDSYSHYAHRHQQYRNGLQPMYAVELYRFSRDRRWIRKHRELLKSCAEWTFAARRQTMQLEDGRQPLHWGLLPKWSYGGDIADEQCYPLYSNFACWRGLKCTADLCRDLGDTTTADRYDQEARDFHTTIMRTIDAIYQRDAKPPVLPPHVCATDAAGGEYYQLFAGMILDLLPFRFADAHANYFGDFLEQDNRTFCQLARFRRDAGPGGLDALYGMGYTLTKLHQQRIREFLLGFYAFQALNMEPTCFTSRETNVVYSSDLHLRTAFPVPDISDPLPCSSAVVLNFLRHMLVTEESLGAGEFTGRLLLLLGAPRQWFEPGKSITVTGAPTHFGKLSLRVAIANTGDATVTLKAPTRHPCDAICLRLPQPAGKPMRLVTVNGSPHTGFDAAAGTVTLPAPRGLIRIVVNY